MSKSNQLARLAMMSWRSSDILLQGQIGTAMLSQQIISDQKRVIGGYPENFGKPSKYTEGTAFLGTPKDHLELVKKRPMSPDVLDIEGVKPHYDFPIAPLSSIINRVSGLALTGEVLLLSTVAVTGDVGVFLNTIKSSSFLLYPAKLLIAFPLTYQLLGGMRHFWWDYTKHSNMADKSSSIDLPQVDQSSYGIIYASLGIAAAATLYSSK